MGSTGPVTKNDCLWMLEYIVWKYTCMCEYHFTAIRFVDVQDKDWFILAHVSACIALCFYNRLSALQNRENNKAAYLLHTFAFTVWLPTNDNVFFQNHRYVIYLRDNVCLLHIVNTSAWFYYCIFVLSITESLKIVHPKMKTLS